LIAVGAISTGGLTALVEKVRRKKAERKLSVPNISEERQS
jgi:hypothetical protein